MFQAIEKRTETVLPSTYGFWFDRLQEKLLFKILLLTIGIRY